MKFVYYELLPFLLLIGIEFYVVFGLMSGLANHLERQAQIEVTYENP